MNFGNLSGLVNGTEQVVYDYTVAGAAKSSIDTATDNPVVLNGNEDGWYTIIIFVKMESAGTRMGLRLNGDSGASYGTRGVNASGGTASSQATTGYNYLDFLLYGASAGDIAFSAVRLYAPTGAVRMLDICTTYGVSATNVAAVVPEVGVWTNTADNLTSMVFPAISGSFAIGTRVIILKSNNFTNGTPTGSITTPYIKGAWVRVGTPSVGTTPGSIILTSTATSITFSNLDGDRDVVYMLSQETKHNASAVSHWSVVQCSGDTSLANYDIERLYAGNTSVTASGATDSSVAGVQTGYHYFADDFSTGTTLIYAKTGFVRPFLSQYLGATTGTSANSIVSLGGVWFNTASNITQLTISGAFNIGSQWQLYALRPNG